MRIRKSDWKSGEIALTAENGDDLWTLRTIIQPGDALKGSTERKVKMGGSEEKGAVIRRRVTLTITVEKAEYAPDGSSLRVLGVITDGPEDIPRGDHHSFGLEPGSDFTLTKASWPRYVRDKLEQATKVDAALLVLLFDREEAKFFGVTKRGIEQLSGLKGDVAKKGLDEKKAANFYQEIVAQLKSYTERGVYRHVVAGAPAFWREYVEKELPPELKKITVMTTISDIESTAIRELLTRPEVEKLLKESSTMRELGLVEEAMRSLAAERLAYGRSEIADAVSAGNVAALLVTENAIAAARKEGEAAMEALELLLRQCEESRGEVHVLGGEEAMRKIDGLGGIVAIKRW